MTGTTLFRSCEPVVDRLYRKDGPETPVETTVKAIAEAAGQDPLEIPPLTGVVDPEIIDKLLDGRDDPRTNRTTLHFEFDEFAVFIRGGGHIRVCDTTRSTEPTPIFGSQS